MKYCIGIFVFLLFQACQSFEKEQLNYALAFAGENRKELEQVLEHYKEDPEKLKAAQFLIRNMPRYYGYEGWKLDSLQKVLSTTLQNSFIPDSVVKKWRKVSLRLLPQVYDAHVITAAYLIENIDLSFKVWKEAPWNRQLPFDDFCELILPYRIGDEPLSNWRIHFYKKYMAYTDSVKDQTNAVDVCHRVAKKLSEENFYYLPEFDTPRFSAKYLFEHRIGFCREMCDVATYTMRACGIPVATDMFVYSPEYQGNHQWEVVRDSAGRFIPFWITTYEIADNTPNDGRKRGKVYRECFGMQKEPVPDITQNTAVPVLFRNRFIKDVTENYTGPNELSVPVDVDDPYIYLGIFSPAGWIPVDIALNKNRTAVFHHVEPGIIYQPLYSDGKKHRPAGFPFLYTRNSFHVFKPDRDVTEKASLSRKMSLVKKIKEFSYRNIIGASLMGCSEVSFGKPKTLLVLQDTLHFNYNEFTPADTSQIRYVRYLSPRAKHIELAEIAFFEDSLCQKELPATIIKQVKPHILANSIDKIQDKNILSFFESQDTSCYIQFDLGKQTALGKIVICPRNDDNYVWTGHQYELFYQAGIEGWKSLGKQTATGRYLDYEVPKNALLWLHDLTKGKEEQVFFYKDNHPYFVTDIQP